MTPRFHHIAAGAIMLALGACATADYAAFDATIAAEAAETTAMDAAIDRVRADVAWLSDDARLGRETGTDAYRDAAEYVAARMEAIGLKPGANGEWFQETPYRAGAPVLDAAGVTITTPDGAAHKLTSLADFRLFPSLMREAFEIDDAPAVFVGYGVSAPAFGHDDYAGVDVKGKIVVYFNGAPDIFDSESRAHFNSTGLKAKEASDRGAIGMIGLYTSAVETSQPWARFIANPSYSSMTWVGPDGVADVSGPNIQGNATLNPAMSQLLFEGAEKSYAEVRAEADKEGGAPKGFDLAVKVSMSGAMTLKALSSPNVAGIIPGADPAKKNEYVILSAHLDHIGVNEKKIEAGEDGINNGAMDNATGVATLLEAAKEMLAGPPPARTVMFLAVAGEEKGLLGADYFAHFPTVGKKGKVVADVNLDMPVLLYSFTDVVAFGAERSSIGPILHAALEKTGVALSPDPIPELGIFTRSDHYRFVEQGVPSIFLWPGFANGGEEAFWDFYKNHYHRPSDDISQPIRYDDMLRFVEINAIIARALADAPERPIWNEGDFFGDLFSK
ncbi:MAG: M28 family metallopeptidase [Parvularculaceae bacterium]